MLSIVPQIAPDLKDSPVLLAPRVRYWLEPRVFDERALERLDAPVVRTPHQILVEALLEPSSADLAWLAWEDGSQSVVVARDRMSPLHPSTIGEFPEPPRSPLTINRASRSGAWALWCRSRGILSATVVPVRQKNEIVGTIGLASCTAGSLDDSDLQRVQLGASLAIQARSHELRLSSLRRMFDEVSRTLENALALDRALRLPPTYREIARSVGESLDASYCQIAVRDARQAITIRAGGGHRPPRRVGSTWALAQLRRCAEALHERRAVVLTFSQGDGASEPERLALFTPTTRTGVLIPFVAGPRTQGVLILGEERESRCGPLTPERIALLELVASRIAHIMRISRRLEYERLVERRRQGQLTVERQRLAREVHDGVGQALSTLLVQIRGAIADGNAGPQELQILERATRRAVDGARALAYGIRHLERGIGALEEARSYAETMLRSVHCRLSWTEERNDRKVANRILREIAHVIKESITNVVRLANARSVRVRVEYPDGRIRVTIHDDSVRSSLREARPCSDGLSLPESSERLARVGGTVDVRS